MKIKPSFLPAIAWFILVTVLLTLPGSTLPQEDWFSKVHFDKWVHIGLFSGLVFLWCWALLRVYPRDKKLRNLFIRIALLGVIYGALMEIVQKYFIPGRSFELGDILADAAGCGIALVYSVGRYIKK